MSPKNQPPDVESLLQSARDDGALSTNAHQVLTVVDLGAQIQAGLGIGVDDVRSSEVVLVSLMPDDSGSIRSAGNEAQVRDGHNLVLDALVASKQRDSVLVHTRYLNGQVLNPYRPLQQAERMDSTNYSADLGTPLYDQSVVLLGTVMAKAQQFAQNGVAVRTVTLILTDGGDCGSTHAKARDVAALVNDMLRSEQHIVAGLGLSDGHTDFRKVFSSMGIPDRWILTPGSSASEIRRAFQVFSQSALRVSQAGAAMGTISLGGFAR